MNQRYINLILILALLALVIWVDVNTKPIDIGDFERTGETVLGLDLQGGMQMLWEADVAEGENVPEQSLRDAQAILENRTNGLGVSEVNFQVAGSNRILGEFPGFTNIEQVTEATSGVGLLEFVDLGDQYLPEGTVIQTDFTVGTTQQPDPTSEPTAAPTELAGEAGSETEPTAAPTEEVVYHTVMTGDQLSSVGVTTDQLGQPVISFELKPEGSRTFAEFTAQNVNKFLAIVLDKRIISAPRINQAITEGSGIIEGQFTLDTANALAVQMRYGSLPVPLKVVESRVIGPTLGADSLNKSLRAGIIGFALVILFMIIYYRLPGVIAILAILSYGAITFALYKLIPVTLTLPGIAGLLLSTGGALDANILIFERLKEELHGGRNLRTATELAWKRAWPSIRDSNIATLITSVILFWFGSAFGASIVKGFALTLALGMAISLFSAIVITRTYLSIALDFINPLEHEKWFGA